MTTEDMKKYTEELIAAPMCCKELREAANGWLASIGTEGQRAKAFAFIAELSEDVNGIDDAIGFYSSPMAAEYFGEEKAKTMLGEALEAKKNGVAYCTCAACTAGGKILDAKEFLF
ncbi:MAG: molecular chaperone Hsp90 [Clostridiales bacterium]|nr:molecular chaperone Hsp90 [Clostridiales bacterium]